MNWTYFDFREVLLPIQKGHGGQVDTTGKFSGDAATLGGDSARPRVLNNQEFLQDHHADNLLLYLSY